MGFFNFDNHLCLDLKRSKPVENEIRARLANGIPFEVAWDSIDERFLCTKSNEFSANGHRNLHRCSRNRIAKGCESGKHQERVFKIVARSRLGEATSRAPAVFMTGGGKRQASMQRQHLGVSTGDPWLSEEKA